MQYFKRNPPFDCLLENKTATSGLVKPGLGLLWVRVKGFFAVSRCLE
jgi:hypothetical protein